MEITAFQELMDELYPLCDTLVIEGIDAKASLEQAAADVYGAPTQVVIETAAQTAGSGRRAADNEPAPLRDDPVVKAFAKHLGGEIVKEKR